VRYSELLRKLGKFGICQVGKLEVDTDTIAYLAKRDEAVFPYQFRCHVIYLEPGETDPEIHEEVVLSILRRFGIDKGRFDAQTLH